jgi:hypothetical protein
MMIWSAPVERSGDGALDSGRANPIEIQSGVASLATALQNSLTVLLANRYSEVGTGDCPTAFDLSVSCP